jgi:hypothetical protein
VLAGIPALASGYITTRIAGGTHVPRRRTYLKRRMWTFRRSPTASQFTIIEVPP